MVTQANTTVRSSAAGQTGPPRPLEGVSVKNSSHHEKNRPSDGRARVAPSQDIAFPQFGSLADPSACTAVSPPRAQNDNTPPAERRPRPAPATPCPPRSPPSPHTPPPPHPPPPPPP